MDRRLVGRLEGKQDIAIDTAQMKNYLLIGIMVILSQSFFARGDIPWVLSEVPINGARRMEYKTSDGRVKFEWEKTAGKIKLVANGKDIIGENTELILPEDIILSKNGKFFAVIVRSIWGQKPTTHQYNRVDVYKLSEEDKPMLVRSLMNQNPLPEGVLSVIEICALADAGDKILLKVGKITSNGNLIKHYNEWIIWDIIRSRIAMDYLW